jgi:hypothetical protein
LLGSNVFARSLTAEEKKSTLAAYVLDMFADASQGPPEIYTCNGKSNAATAALLSPAAGSVFPRPFQERNAFGPRLPFTVWACPRALFAQGVSDAIYHTPDDTADKLSYDYMDLVFAYAAAVLMRAELNEKHHQNDCSTENENMKILYEDNHLLCAEKPQNMPVVLDASGDYDMLSALNPTWGKNTTSPGRLPRPGAPAGPARRRGDGFRAHVQGRRAAF